MSPAFADRLAALVERRRSQICLGIDPNPATLPAQPRPGGGDSAAEAASAAAVSQARELIATAGEHCVAAKLQLACFERLGAPGWRALEEVADLARAAGLLVVADGKRGDVPVSAAVYADSLFAGTDTPWGRVEGLGADAATVNPLLGADSLAPLIAAAASTGAGVFALVRTSNPGAADFLDLDSGGSPLHERVARLVADRAGELAGESGLSGMGAVVGATEPQHLARLRELMPNSIFLIPGVGAQGGSAEALGPAFSTHPASALVTASRSIGRAEDPSGAAARLREQVWAASQSAAR